MKLQRNAPAVTSPRYFGSVRTVLMVRLDPGTKDGYLPDDIRVETTPNPYLQARRNSQFKSALGTQPTGPRVFSEQAREAITLATESIGDCLTKIPRGDGLTIILDVQPIRSRRVLNTYRKADELELTLDWRAVPFDARTVRAIYALHYEGCVPADAFGTGERSLDPSSPTATGYLVPASGGNLRFVGIADEISDSHGDDGDQLSIKFRDLSALLIDCKWPDKLQVKIPSGATIPQVIRSILDTNPAFGLLRGPFLRIEGSPPVLTPARYVRCAVSASERHRQEKTGSTSTFMIRNAPKSGGDSSYWDVITDLCVSHELRPYVEKDKLILVEPRVVYKSRPEYVTQPGVPTYPTEYRKSIGDTYPIRRMVYGSNILSMSFQRKLARIKAPYVQVTARNPDAPDRSNRLLEVYWPNKPEGKASTANSVDATGNEPEVTIHRVQLPGIVDRSQLLRIAEQVYEGMGRQEMGVVITTNDPASFSDNPEFDGNKDPDLLALQMGDPIRVFVQPAIGQSSRLYTLSELQSMIDKVKNVASSSGNQTGYQSAIRYLTNLGWTGPNAKAFVRVLASACLQNEFRLVGATVDFDGESNGFQIVLDCRNYIRVRADPQDIAQTRSPGAARPGMPESDISLSSGVISVNGSSG